MRAQGNQNVGEELRAGPRAVPNDFLRAARAIPNDLPQLLLSSRSF